MGIGARRHRTVTWTGWRRRAASGRPNRWRRPSRPGSSRPADKTWGRCGSSTRTLRAGCQRCRRTVVHAPVRAGRPAGELDPFRSTQAWRTAPCRRWQGCKDRPSCRRPRRNPVGFCMSCGPAWTTVRPSGVGASATAAPMPRRCSSCSWPSCADGGWRTGSSLRCSRRPIARFVDRGVRRPGRRRLRRIRAGDRRRAAQPGLEGSFDAISFATGRLAQAPIALAEAEPQGTRELVTPAWRRVPR